MEVHAHTHTPRKKWTHYFWEFLMLFLAVFCGFLAEYQLEHFIEQQRAKDYALSLHRDLATDTSSFNANIERLNTCSRKIDTLVGLLSYTEQIKQNTSPIYNLSVYAFVFPESTPTESTLQQLLNSGALRYFKDNSLVDSIKVYNNTVQLFKKFSETAATLNIEFRKKQVQIIEISPVIEFLETNVLLYPGLMRDVTDTAFFKNRQLLTNELFLFKEYANWCSLKKFYLMNSFVRYRTLKTQATSVLTLLSKKYSIK